ncbi:hypothetical protein PanWU01x14_082740 [Parasponia andersonii]|uniref:Uncharacterized protein n=1 Tax=Parasponia andersonii TaxID=3476 RepID=A0A2P5D9Z4_PARAD|nr:hypothetical protein PanWU01x14_082740 [Parasponia andersonii]
MGHEIAQKGVIWQVVKIVLFGTAMCKGRWQDGEKNIESLVEGSVGESSLQGDRGFQADEFQEVEEEIEVYGVNSIKKLQTIKDKEYDDRHSGTRRVDQSNVMENFYSENLATIRNDTSSAVQRVARADMSTNLSLHNDGDNSCWLGFSPAVHVSLNR